MSPGTTVARKARPNVLVADDEATIRKLLEVHMSKVGLNAVLAMDGQEAIELMNEEIQAAFLDMMMPRATGLEVLAHIRKHFPDCPVIMMSAKSQVEDAVEAMKQGALEYVTKPFVLDELLSLAHQAVRMSRMSQQNKQLQEVISGSKPINGFMGRSPAGRDLLRQVETFAGLDSTVLITGSSGVGKSLLARTLHYSGPRASGPFISVSCPSLPRELLESEMFGHEKGAFTGAIQQRIGRVEMADGGTLFLDEIGDLPLALQPKLLTFLQEREFQRVGGTKIHRADVRVIAATNANLAEMVRNHDFREDLYFRLNVLPLAIPALADRREDIEPIAESILERIARTRKTSAPFYVEPDAREAMINYDWPGNVRELENVLERATAFCRDGRIRREDLTLGRGNSLATAPVAVAETVSPAVAAVPSPTVGGPSADGNAPPLFGYTLDELERLAIIQTLEGCHGNRSEAARRLGISEKTIYNKINRWNLRG